MNNKRRKTLRLAINEFCKIKFSEIRSEVENVKASVEQIMEEEQEAFDNMPDSLQMGEKGQDMDAAISKMTEAIEKLDAILEAIEENEVEEIVTAIDEAKGSDN